MWYLWENWLCGRSRIEQSTDEEASCWRSSSAPVQTSDINIYHGLRRLVCLHLESPQSHECASRLHVYSHIFFLHIANFASDQWHSPRRRTGGWPLGLPALYCCRAAGI